MTNLLDKIQFKLKNLFTKKESIPSILHKRGIIEKYRKEYNPGLFIETGTFLGDTVEYFKNKFSSLISIELSEELAAKAQKRFEADKQVKIVQGDSSKVLPGLLSNIKTPVLFWLDGHYSSEFFVNDEFIKTARGESNTPIIQELKIILSSVEDPLILIDDARLFNGQNDYPTIKEIVQLVQESNKQLSVLVSDDIIHIIPV